MFSKDGSIGKMFNGMLYLFCAVETCRVLWDSQLTCSSADGALGGTAQKIGGPLDKEGMVGQHFNADGKIGGMVQQNLADNK